MTSASSLLVAFAVGLLATVQAAADPLHRVGDTTAWRHELSGWLFPLALDNLQRVGTPYLLEGSDDAGAQYTSRDDAGVQLELQVHALARAPDWPQGVPWSLSDGIRGQREISSDPPQFASARYRLIRDSWVVDVRVVAQGNANLAMLDAAVRALPWDSLGSEDRLH